MGCLSCCRPVCLAHKACWSTSPAGTPAVLDGADAPGAGSAGTAGHVSPATSPVQPETAREAQVARAGHREAASYGIPSAAVKFQFAARSAVTEAGIKERRPPAPGGPAEASGEPRMEDP